MQEGDQSRNYQHISHMLYLRAGTLVPSHNLLLSLSLSLSLSLDSQSFSSGNTYSLPESSEVHAASLSNSIHSKRSLRLGASGGEPGSLL